MNENSTEELLEMARRLGGIVGDGGGGNAIVPDHGPDESMLIGTKDSFLLLAKMLIEIVCCANDRSTWENTTMGEETVAGKAVVSTNEIKHAFVENSVVWPMCAYLAQDQPTADAVVAALSSHWKKSSAT